MIERVDKEAFDKVWSIASEISLQERYFTDIHVRFHTLASTWLLGTFAAIGFVATQPLRLGLPTELLVAGIAAAGCIGITLLWALDLLVYHRLLDSYFIEGLKLEEHYQWLPPFRHNMMKTQRGQGVLSRLVVFYQAPIMLLTLIAGGSTAIWMGKGHAAGTWLVAATSLALLIVEAFAIPRATANTAALRTNLAADPPSGLNNLQ